MEAPSICSSLPSTSSPANSITASSGSCAGPSLKTSPATSSSPPTAASSAIWPRESCCRAKSRQGYKRPFYALKAAKSRDFPRSKFTIEITGRPLRLHDKSLILHLLTFPPDQRCIRENGHFGGGWGVRMASPVDEGFCSLVFYLPVCADGGLFSARTGRPGGPTVDRPGFGKGLLTAVTLRVTLTHD